MNENFAAETNCCENIYQFRQLLERFGPFAGRYLIAYPKIWFDVFEKQISHWGEVEQERAKTLLRRARENAAILSKPNLKWDESKTWLDNAIQRNFDGIIISQIIDNINANNIYICNDIELPLTADERIYATSEEYVRISRILLLISHELFFVDPYMNPCKQSISIVFEKLLHVIEFN